MRQDGSRKHESYGMVSLSRLHRGGSGRSTLFGSDIAFHPVTIELQVTPAEWVTGDGDGHAFGHGAPLIVIEMSATQFAQLITTVDTPGTPCTIKSAGGKRMEEPPDYGTEMERAEEEFEVKAKNVLSQVADQIRNATARLRDRTPIKVSEREGLIKIMEGIRREVTSNLPYLLNLFHEKVSKATQAAKSEIEAFTELSLRQVGLNSIKQVMGRGADEELAEIKASPEEESKEEAFNDHCPGCCCVDCCISREKYYRSGKKKNLDGGINL